MQHIVKPLAYASIGARCVTEPRKSVAAGETGDVCHIIIEGVLASYHLLPDGREQVVAYHLPGDVCGLASLSDRGRDDHLSAVTPAVSAPISLSSLVDLAEGSSAIGRALLHQMAVDAAIARHWVTNLGQRSAFLRIARLACELESRLGAIGLAEGSSFRWFGTQKDIGAATGLSLVHVNRSLKGLGAERLLEWKQMTVRILDRERLYALVDFDPAYLGLDGPKLGDLLFAADASGSRRVFDENRRSREAPSTIPSAMHGG